MCLLIREAKIKFSSSALVDQASANQITFSFLSITSVVFAIEKPSMCSAPLIVIHHNVY
jgi:hypothetical protein